MEVKSRYKVGDKVRILGNHPDFSGLPPRRQREIKVMASSPTEILRVADIGTFQGNSQWYQLAADLGDGIWHEDWLEPLSDSVVQTDDFKPCSADDINNLLGLQEIM